MNDDLPIQRQQKAHCHLVAESVTSIGDERINTANRWPAETSPSYNERYPYCHLDMTELDEFNLMLIDGGS
jgi:hypothetical protein